MLLFLCDVTRLKQFLPLLVCDISVKSQCGCYVIFLLSHRFEIPVTHLKQFLSWLVCDISVKSVWLLCDFLVETPLWSHCDLPKTGLIEINLWYHYEVITVTVTTQRRHLKITTVTKPTQLCLLVFTTIWPWLRSDVSSYSQLWPWPRSDVSSYSQLWPWLRRDVALKSQLWPWLSSDITSKSQLWPLLRSDVSSYSQLWLHSNVISKSQLLPVTIESQINIAWTTHCVVTGTRHIDRAVTSLWLHGDCNVTPITGHSNISDYTRKLFQYKFSA